MGITARSFEEPDELVTLPLLEVRVVVLGEVYVARTVHQPGWTWSQHVGPVAGTATCQHHHQGVVVSGQVEVEGSDLQLEDAGEHELKGLPGRRRVFRLAAGAAQAHR